MVVKKLFINEWEVTNNWKSKSSLVEYFTSIFFSESTKISLICLRFVKILVDQLKEDFRQWDRASTSIINCDEIRLNGKLRVILNKKKKEDWKVCSDGRRETTRYCDTCPDKPRVLYKLSCTHKNTEINIEKWHF